MSKSRITTNKSNLINDIKEIVIYKDLFLTLTYRDFKVKYAQTLIGLLWAFLQPVATITIFTIIFGKAINVDTGGIDYPLFVVIGMSCWTFFSAVMMQSGNSLISSQEMVKKIYFPRLIIPLSKSIVGLVDFFIAFVFIIFFTFYYNNILTVKLFFLPLFFIALVMASLGIGIWISALTIRYRDFQHITPFLVQFGLYASPVAYSSESLTKSLPEWVNFIYFINPITGIIEGFRFSFLDNYDLSTYCIISLLMSTILFITSLFYFKKIENNIADII